LFEWAPIGTAIVILDEATEEWSPGYLVP
jgi:hypothetical protein